MKKSRVVVVSERAYIHPRVSSHNSLITVHRVVLVVVMMVVVVMVDG